MNMTKLAHVLIGLLLLGAAACKNAEEKTTPNGFKFQVVKKGDGIVAKPSQLLIFEYTVTDSKDSVWQSTYDNGFPMVYTIQDTAMQGSEPGAMQMFRMLSAADSVTVTRPAKEFFKDVFGGPTPPQVDTTTKFTLNINVLAVLEQQKFEAFAKDLNDKRKGTQKIKDANLIDKFLKEKNITAQQDTSGIRYVIHKTAGGQKPSANDCVEVSYEGKFLKDGKTFDKNPKMAFSLNQVITGWKLSIPMLGVGDSATFYIPSALAYGPQGYPGAIPPNAILIFDVKLLNTATNFDPMNRICVATLPTEEELKAPEAKAGK